MNEEKSKNSFSRYVREVDWLGYKNEVSTINKTLFVKLSKKVPLIAKLDKMALSKVRRDRILFNIIFLSILYLPFIITGYVFEEKPILKVYIPILFLIGVVQYPLLIISLYESFNSLMKSIFLSIPTIFILIPTHFIYCVIIFFKNRDIVSIEFLNAFYMFARIYGVSILLVSMFYYNVKDLQLESITWNIILISGAIIIGAINVWQLRTLHKIDKIKSSELRQNTNPFFGFTSISVFVTTFAYFFVFLSNPVNDHIKNNMIFINLFLSTIVFLLKSYLMTKLKKPSFYRFNNAYIFLYKNDLHSRLIESTQLPNGNHV